jgi:hypothetical protein
LGIPAFVLKKVLEKSECEFTNDLSHCVMYRNYSSQIETKRATPDGFYKLLFFGGTFIICVKNMDNL